MERYADLIVDILDALSFFLITPQLLRVADVALGVVVQGLFVIATISVCATPLFLIANNNISHNFDYRFMIPETYGYPFVGLMWIIIIFFWRRIRSLSDVIRSQFRRHCFVLGVFLFGISRLIAMYGALSKFVE